MFENENAFDEFIDILDNCYNNTIVNDKEKREYYNDILCL